MLSSLRVLPLLLLLLLTAYRAHADVIYYKNGKTMKTPRISAGEGTVKCILYGGEVTFQPAEIERVETSNSPGRKKLQTRLERKRWLRIIVPHDLAQEAYELATSNSDSGANRVQVAELPERARETDADETEIFLVAIIQALQDGYKFGPW